ncbi:kynureninase [Paremcibacter congregatus]|uniref:Kynureninase n=1 Tax=Paremcibacter congregatus TaxID=2043170 RepID=A0A2G4YMS0_9PROT|nr:kynureninase [Paremcibacter congregatus]PHZ83622.1 kynureninase [Paremcibacter congregatus]QDE27322.1 kynureninase [Paremcibacter congregatus]
MPNYTREDFLKLDENDPLAAFRDEFELPEDLIYLDGNSLGAMPKSAKARALDVVEREWGQDLITSWNKNGWFHLTEKLGNKIASLIGAASGEVLACDATGLNLYKLLSMALDLREGRKVIVMEGSNFPTDNYMTQGLIKQRGQGHEIRFAEIDQIIDAITEDVAVVSLTQVHYKTGHLLDMKAITEKAHAVGALVIWDLCHSAGALPIDLNKCDVDFAVGCGYKYLNGGPGAPAFIFVAKRHQGTAAQPLTGWWSHAAPFAFERDYRPSGTIWQSLTGTQPILSLSVLECGLDVMMRADMADLRQKSITLCDYFIELVESECGKYGFELATPRNGEARGSQVSFRHDYGYAIMQALIADKVIGDFRAPNIVRFGFTPLYVRYVDVWDAVARLKKIMKYDLWKNAKYNQLTAVT